MPAEKRMFAVDRALAVRSGKLKVRPLAKDYPDKP